MDWGKIKHFRPEEFAGEMDPDLIQMLDNARGLAGVPFELTSTRRSGGGTSEHNTGHGVDIRCHDARSRFEIVTGLIRAGFRRIGIYDRHIHAGNSGDHDQDVIWIGKSR